MYKTVYIKHKVSDGYALCKSALGQSGVPGQRSLSHSVLPHTVTSELRPQNKATLLNIVCIIPLNSQNNSAIQNGPCHQTGKLRRGNVSCWLRVTQLIKGGARTRIRVCFVSQPPCSHSVLCLLSHSKFLGTLMAEEKTGDPQKWNGASGCELLGEILRLLHGESPPSTTAQLLPKPKQGDTRPREQRQCRAQVCFCSGSCSKLNNREPFKKDF